MTGAGQGLDGLVSTAASDSARRRSIPSDDAPRTIARGGEATHTISVGWL